MARTAKTIRTPAKRAAEPAPKKRIGRPLGSKNRAPVAARKTATAVRKPVARKVAKPVAPKLNKAELEAQVLKLERTIARLKKQNAELKLTAKAPVADLPEPVAEKKPRRNAAVKTRRSRTSTDAADLDLAGAEG